MYFFVCVVLAFLFAASSTAAPVPVRETNASRFARGLPPLRPRFGSILPGVNPTPIYAAKRAYPSPNPPKRIYAGRIQVRNSEGNSLGYVKNWPGVSSIDGINYSGSDEELHVTFTLPPTTLGPFDILATNPKFQSPYYVGVSSGAQPATLGAGQPNGISFINVPQSPPGAPPTNTGAAYTESAIWYFNPSTKELTPLYINPDGSQPKTIISYNIRSNQLFLVGDIDAWNSQHVNTPSSPVMFFLDDV